ncbi:MAG: nickel-dependent hydrogenase large subunit [Candidatus Hodarchaeota archaeon]
MLKVVEVCKRVEGHGDVKILIQNDEIYLVNFEFQIYREFEKFLIGKKLIDIPKIISRICGLCHTSQEITSCKAIENIYNVKVHEQSILLRRLLMSSELIKSHSMHFFFQALPDLLTIFDPNHKLFSLYDLINFDPQLTANFYELIKIGNEINILFGGRSLHLISLIPGGVIYSPSRKKIILARKYFQKFLSNLEWIIEKLVDSFSNKVPPKEYSLPNYILLSLTNYGNYDRYSGDLRIKENHKNVIDFKIHSYLTYFGKEINLRGIDFYFDNKNNIIVGPFSRCNIVDKYEIDEINNYYECFNKSWKNNILFINFIRLLEMYIESYQGLQILDDPSLNNKIEFPSLNSVKKLDGIGVIEAPRGTLIHHYHSDENGYIDQINLFVATEFNIPIINKMITKYAQELFEKTGDINLVRKKVQIIIRAFDPCISCVTH